MKKLLTLLAILFTINVSASHIMGGMITVANNGPDSTALGLYLLSDPSGTMPSSITLEMWKDDGSGWYVPDGYITVTGTSVFMYQGHALNTYISDYVDLDSGNYRFIYRTCCWPLLNNATNAWQSDMVISTDYLHTPSYYTSTWQNITPYMEQPLWVNVEKNSVNSMKPVWGIFNCHFTNPEGDSVNLTMTDIYSNYSNGVFVPQTPQVSTNVLAGNDSITFVGTTLGKHGYGFQIDRYRNGMVMSTQRIQWTFIVRNSTLGIEEETIEREVIGVWDWHGHYIQKDMKGLPGDKFYLIRYSDNTYDKVLLMKQ
jgi:hypothetical protein